MDKKLWYVQASCPDGYSWDYHVLAATKEEASQKVVTHWNHEGGDGVMEVNEVHGPFEMKDVLTAKEPNF